MVFWAALRSFLSRDSDSFVHDSNDYNCVVLRPRTIVVSWHSSTQPVTSTIWLCHSLTACCACVLRPWRHRVNTTSTSITS